MTLDDLLDALFPAGHELTETGPDHSFAGEGQVASVGTVTIAGIKDSTPFSVDAAIFLARHVLNTLSKFPVRPIIMLVDTASQNMMRRDELLGLNEYLAHLTKSLLLAGHQGHRTVSVLYGGAAAGAFISTSLASQDLIALPGAAPSVMDLPSISRVTRLPLDQLEALSRTTPIFAPGVDPLYQIGAVTETWPNDASIAERLSTLLQTPHSIGDTRDQLGLERRGRLMAHQVAQRVQEEATHG